MCIMICDMMVGKQRAKRTLASTLVIFSALLASGCVQPQPVKDDVQMATTPEQARSAPTQPALRQVEPEPEKPAKKSTTAAKQPEAAPEIPADQTVYRATELVGKSQTEVTALIGAPARVEQRAASTVWTYRKDECGLDVFFFLDMASADERVLTVESTSDKAATTDTTGVAATSAAPAGTATTADATASAPAPGEIVSDADGGSIADACYGKLRRS